MTLPITESHDHTMLHDGINEQRINTCTCVYDIDLEYTEMIDYNVKQRNKWIYPCYMQKLVAEGMDPDTEYSEMNKLANENSKANEEDCMHNDRLYGEERRVVDTAKKIVVAEPEPTEYEYTVPSYVCDPLYGV